MKIIYLFIGSCILADGARISQHPRIFKYRKNISLSKGYLNIGFRNEKDIMRAECYAWVSIKDNKNDGNDQTLLLNHPHLYNVFCVVSVYFIWLFSNELTAFLNHFFFQPWYLFSSSSSANESDSATASSNESNVSLFEIATLNSLSSTQRSKNIGGTTIAQWYLSSQCPPSPTAWR